MLYDTGDTIYCPFQQGGLILWDDDDEIHTTKRRHVPQAYRVVATAGGIPLQKTLAPRTTRSDADPMDDLFFANWVNSRGAIPGNQLPGLSRSGLGIPSSKRMKNKYSPLYVMCFCNDFDGVKYGTVTEAFDFKPHEGEVD